jgi:hypothetical protein
MTSDRDDVTNRLADRFEDDDEDDDSESRSTDDTNSMNARSSRNASSAVNVKKEWNAKTVYLSDDLDDQLAKAFKRLDLDLDDDLENLRKTRHFYPLIVQAGLEGIEEMERNEVLERIEGIERKLSSES